MLMKKVERTPEFEKLTADRAWTVADVRSILPDVPVLMPGGIAAYGEVRGRNNDFASVSVVGICATTTGEFAWSTIAAALNNNRALRF